MKKRLLFVLCLIVGLGNIAFAQTKTVTNADLEKFKEKRLQSEKDLRENYQKLGFPSPEELAKRNEQKRAELEQLSIQLRQEEYQKQLAAARQSEILSSQSGYWGGQNNDNFLYSTGFDSYGYPTFGYFNYSQPYRTGFKRRLNYYGGRSTQRGNVRIGGGYAFPSPFGNAPRGRVTRIRAPR